MHLTDKHDLINNLIIVKKKLKANLKKTRGIDQTTENYSG